MAEKQKEAKQVNTIHQNSILEETIKKEMRRHRLTDSYMLSPKIKNTLVLTATPNTAPVHLTDTTVRDGK
ncbi:hypothetical protein BKA69DRAFT_296542 [Paraphysoderma sedebokerense]|nr:hypothetical protein BKA69DRAFT_296542 [Paraphysoderma sedebokerense]